MLPLLMIEPPSRDHLRIKAGTAVATGAVIVGALVFVDWDSAVGRENVFSGIRPAVKRVLNRVYGIRPDPSEAADPKAGSR